MWDRDHMMFCIEITFPKIMKLYLVLNGCIKNMYVFFGTMSMFKTSRPEFVLGPTQCPINGYRVLSRGGCVKRLERDVDHSPPSSAKVKNERSRTCTPPHAQWQLHSYCEFDKPVLNESPFSIDDLVLAVKCQRPVHSVHLPFYKVFGL